VAARHLKCLFVSPVVPYPPDSGGRIRTFRLLCELQDKAEVHLRAVCESPQARAGLANLEPHCASVRGFERGALDAWTRLTRPKRERWCHSPALSRALREELASERYDVVHVDEMFQARALPGEIEAPLVVHHHKLDCEFQQLVPIAPGMAGAFDLFKLRRLEAWSARRTKFHVLTSDGDAARLASRHPGLVTAVVESGFDPTYFQPPVAARASDELLFLGSLDYAPNIDGLHWFVREVLPAIAARFASVRLRVVGRAPVPEVVSLAGPRVSIVGGVDDVRPELERASVLVVPLRIGGGTRVKIVEAMGCETPIVSTTIGAEGLAFRDPEHLGLADRAQAFAARVCEILDDPLAAGLQAQRGRQLALERYTWSDLAGKLLAAWQRAIQG